MNGYQLHRQHVTHHSFERRQINPPFFGSVIRIFKGSIVRVSILRNLIRYRPDTRKLISETHAEHEP